MKNAFTLLELLVVIGIMGFLGTISVGGYRAMQRGMEERGVMQNVNAFVEAAYERAQIDRQPTAIYFWNETLRAASDDETELVVGKAVAVRRQGRLSRVSGNRLIDEFADLNLVYKTSGDDDSSEGADAADKENTMYLYCLDNMGSSQVQVKRSIVSNKVRKDSLNEQYMQGLPTDNAGSGAIEAWGFEKVGDDDSVNWKAGSAYGFEFAELTLPANYIFGSSYSQNVDAPVAGKSTMTFSVGRNDGSNTTGAQVNGSITVYALRPSSSGSLSPVRVNTADNPTR